MKKILLSLLLLSTTFSITAEEKVLVPNALDTISNEYHTHFIDLPFWAKARIAAFSTFGAAWVWVVTHAFTNIFQAKQRPLDITDLSTWTWPQYVATPASFVFLTKALLENETPEGIARSANKSGLLRALLACNTTQEIKETIDLKYVSLRFPRATAFTELSNLRTSLQRILELVTNINKHRKHKTFTTIAKNLSDNLTTVEKTLLLIKSDPRWFEECNALTLQSAQRVDEARFNAQLAGSAVNLAHAYTTVR